MVANLYQTFDSGQPGGTTITTGNSGVGGNAFDLVTIGASASVTFVSANVIRGTLSGEFTTPASVVAASATWSTAIGTALPRAYGRAVIRPLTTAVVNPFARCRGTAVQAFRLTINASGKVELRNTANTVVATSSGTITTADTWLVRWDVTVGASVTGVLYIHTDPTVATPTETLTANAANFGTNNIDEFACGITVATASASMRMDDLVFTDQGAPGPASQVITITETISVADSLAALGFTPAATLAPAEQIMTSRAAPFLMPSTGT